MEKLLTRKPVYLPYNCQNLIILPSRPTPLSISPSETMQHTYLFSHLFLLKICVLTFLLKKCQPKEAVSENLEQGKKKQVEGCSTSKGPRLKCHGTLHGIGGSPWNFQESNRNYKLQVEKSCTGKHFCCF